MIQFERYVLYVNSFWSSVMWWRSYFVYWTLRNRLQWIQAFFPPSYAFESTVEPLWKGQECLTKVVKFGPFRYNILYKSCLFYPSWQATSFERPPSWVAFIEGFHCICQLLAILFRPQCIDTTRFLLTSVYLYKLISVCLNTMYQFIKSMTQVTCFFSFSQIKVTLHKTWVEYICFRRLVNT